MIGMVFAAGLGTRLRPLTERLPKPVVPLMNRPLATYSLERLAALGVARVAINTHHLAEAARRELGPYLPEGARVVHEPRLLGTGGGLRRGLETLLAEAPDSGPYVVMNGDILFWPDLETAIALHTSLGAIATMVLRRDPRARHFGALEIDPGGRLRRLLGKPEIHQGPPLREMMFTGVHVLSPRALRDLPEEGCIIQRAYRRWVDEGEVVVGYVEGASWRDLGTPVEYLRAHLDLLRGDLTWPGRTTPPPMFECADDVVLEECVVGQGARIASGSHLRRCVVWPDTDVAGTYEDSILAPHAVVAAGPDSR